VPKTLIYKHLGSQMKQLRSLKKSLQWARSKRKKTLEGPTVFCKRGTRCQRKSMWTARFLTLSSKFHRKNGSCFLVVCRQAFFYTSTPLRQRGLKFWSCFLFHLLRVSYLACQVSIVASKYGLIVVECWYFNVYYYLSSEAVKFSS